MTRKLMLAAAAMLVLTGCDQLGTKAGETPAEAPAPAALPTQADVDAAYDRLDAALKAKDAAALAAFYAPTAVLVDPMQNAVVRNDPANAVAGTTEWLKMEPAYTVNSVETQILDADTFVASGVITMDFKRNGRPTWVVQRFTDVWQKQADGQWQIVTSHVSNAPRPVAARLPALEPAAAPAPDAPPLGGSTPAPAPAPAHEKK